MKSRILQSAPTGLRRRALLAVLLASGLGAATAVATPGRAQQDWHGTAVTAEARTAPDGRRRYRLGADEPGHTARERVVTDLPGRPSLRTRSPLFDGLFALSMQEIAEDSVEEIRDAAFNDDHPIQCRCFETGARWHYVWTRDVSYAADLGLALLEPERTRASLWFKTSAVRPELIAAGVAPLVLVAQDTGSGGSWPVSTDRVVWLHAAYETLDGLPDGERDAVAAQLHRIAADTLAQDREFAFDPAVGLYRGETSFLDWREQTYPGFTARDTRFIAESFALSTNVLHYAALRDTAALTRRVHATGAEEYEREAANLKEAINRWFWIEDAGLYASYLAPGRRPWALHTYDLLGLSLAVIHGIADARQARLVVRRYPRTEAGPPVIFPERPDVAIYHNRAIWPFVTAYALRSAAQAREAGVASELARSLIRGTATALSNMENFEYLTGRTAFADGPLSGPVINSPRQLWSVAAFAGLAVETLWGVRLRGDVVAVEPFMPGAIAREIGAPRARLALHGLDIRGRRLTVRLTLPAALPRDAWLAARRVTLNGRAVPAAGFAIAALSATGPNVVDVELRVAGRAAAAPPPVPVADPRSMTVAERAAWVAPPPPTAPAGARIADAVQLQLPEAAPGTELELFRDGMDLAASGATFGERLPAAAGGACYSLLVRQGRAGLESLPGPALCLPPETMGETVPAADSRVAGADASGDPPAFRDWGGPAERLTIDLDPRASGLAQLRVEYRNEHGPVNTGVTAAVKRIVARCGSSDPEHGVIVMPHAAPAAGAALSTAFRFRVRAAEHCRIELSDGFNMSYLQHFALYTGGEGGRGGALNRATVAAFHFEYLGAAPADR